MAMQEAESSPVVTVEMVANKFVELYYAALHTKPEIVHKFYQDSSVITRPNLTGEEMSSVSTMQGIHDKILSSEYHSSKVQIASIDIQKSFKNGIVVLVTGFLIGEDEMKRSFTQTFFLAPLSHVTGYFVLNDIFKFGIDVETIVATPLTEENQKSSREPDQQAEVKPSELTHVVKPFEVKQSKVTAEKVNSNDQFEVDTKAVTELTTNSWGEPGERMKEFAQEPYQLKEVNEKEKDQGGDDSNEEEEGDDDDNDDDDDEEEYINDEKEEESHLKMLAQLSKFYLRMKDKTSKIIKKLKNEVAEKNKTIDELEAKLEKSNLKASQVKEENRRLADDLALLESWV